MNLDDREGRRQVAAAEFLLGKLSVEDRAAFEDRLCEDLSLRDLVEAWRVRLDVPAPHPPRSNGRKKEAPEADEQAAKTRLRRRLATWRMIAFAGTVTAAAMAYFLFARPPILPALSDAARAPVDRPPGSATSTSAGAENGGTD